MYSVVLATMLSVGGGSTTAWCHGCHGCHGYAYCHGYSSCHGCCGGWYSCRGCYGCWGGYAGYACYGSSFYGCTGCCGGVVAYPSYGCCGCCGGAVYVPAVIAPVVAVPYANSRVDAYDAKPQAARLTVSLPSNARLWVDNVKCPLISGQRSFNTPALKPGTEYFYTLRMEVDRDGQVVTENRRVLVAAGRSVNVDFNAPATVTAQW